MILQELLYFLMQIIASLNLEQILGFADCNINLKLNRLAVLLLIPILKGRFFLKLVRQHGNLSTISNFAIIKARGSKQSMLGIKQNSTYFGSDEVFIDCYLQEYIYLFQQSLMQAQGQVRKSGRMLIIASLRHHNPDEVYDYVEKNIGALGMCIKKRQAVIGFTNPKFYQKLMNENGAMLHGKRLKLTYLENGDENQIVSEQEEVVQMPKIREQQKKSAVEKSKSENSVEAKINTHRALMKEKIEESFNATIQTSRDRIHEMKLQFKQNSHFNRQIRTLQQTLEKKFSLIQNKYEEQIKKLTNYIRNFSSKPTTYQIEPSFKTEPTRWLYQNQHLNDLKMNAHQVFSNQDRYPCKRICPINGEQFAVSMFNDNKKLGALKIYNVNTCDQKFSETNKNGTYGMCCVNNYLLVGSYKSSISYINLDDDQRDVQTSSTFIDLEYQFTDLMVVKNDVEAPEILVLAREKQRKLRKIKVTKDQITPGLQSLSFEENLQIPAEDVNSFEIGAPNIIWFGGNKKISKYCLATGRRKDLQLKQPLFKIKKFNQNLLVIGSYGIIELYDTRSEGIVQKFSFLPKDINSLEVLSQNNIIYGSHCQIGVLDDRKNDVILWIDKTHKGYVYDIAKMNKNIITCDSSGLIYSWTLDFQKNQTFPDGIMID